MADLWHESLHCFKQQGKCGAKNFCCLFPSQFFCRWKCETYRIISSSNSLYFLLFTVKLFNVSGWRVKKIKAPDHPETHSDDCFMVVYGNQMMAQKTPSSLTIGKKSNYSLFSGAKKWKFLDQLKTHWDACYHLFSMKKSDGMQKSICPKIQKSHTIH